MSEREPELVGGVANLCLTERARGNNERRFAIRTLFW